MSTIEFICGRLKIAPFVSPYTEGLKRRGRPGFYAGRCPFCGKKTFWVNADTGFCGCWRNDCQAEAPGGRPMDVINFYARLNGLDNNQAIAALWQSLQVDIK